MASAPGPALHAGPDGCTFSPDFVASSIALTMMADVLFHLKVEGEGDYVFFQVNPAFYKATMLRPEQVLGKRVQEVIPPASLPMVTAAYQRAIETRATQHWEEVSVYPSGRKVGQVTVTPVFDGAGSCTDLVGTVHDVSRLADREDQLRFAQVQLESSLAEQRALARGCRRTRSG